MACCGRGSKKPIITMTPGAAARNLPGLVETDSTTQVYYTGAFPGPVISDAPSGAKYSVGRRYVLNIYKNDLAHFLALPDFTQTLPEVTP